jgi:hypothetical protein
MSKIFAIYYETENGDVHQFTLENQHTFTPVQAQDILTALQHLSSAPFWPVCDVPSQPDNINREGSYHGHP